MKPVTTSGIIFNTGKEERVMAVFDADTLPKEIKRVYDLLKAVAGKPRDYGGRELADIVADLAGPDADRAEKLLRASGSALVVTRLKEALKTVKDEAAAARMRRLLKELER